MSATITIRIPEAQRRNLIKKSRLNGKSASAFVRDVLQRELDEAPLDQRAGHFKGVLSLPRSRRKSFRDAIRDHNWRK